MTKEELIQSFKDYCADQTNDCDRQKFLDNVMQIGIYETKHRQGCIRIYLIGDKEAAIIYFPEIPFLNLRPLYNETPTPVKKPNSPVEHELTVQEFEHLESLFINRSTKI